ncbi:disulfide bond formation protein DsbB [Novosphingobium kunmingense]|uniref:Disulfide bond formation protein DsbB n=1 Tax=Novosphingobium kunmingense TaxID=1211806 RepID=A0A2N0H562_9SPHN|nr:disulfide bond formation protein B [Novosphingobium kunmingense]PKB14064.1 disulfide bond formation protein DsbB [Novosphingobium kunmingense]
MLPTGDKAIALARVLALGVPAALLAGAYIGQYGFDLYPCEMCWWQRWPHFVAMALAALAFGLRGSTRLLVALAALAILASGLIGAFHAGVEYGWWEGFTTCTANVGAAGGDPLEAILGAPIVRCDQVQWELFGISLAGFNFLISTAAAALIAVLLRRSKGIAA